MQNTPDQLLLREIIPQAWAHGGLLHEQNPFFFENFLHLFYIDIISPHMPTYDSHFLQNTCRRVSA